MTATLVAGLVLVTAAEGAPTWLPPATLSNQAQPAETANVAFDTNGNSITVWARSNGANRVIQAAIRPAGGSFGGPVNLSASGRDAFDPDVAFDGSGRAIAVWRRINDAGKSVIQFAVRPAGGSFGAPQNVSDTGQNSFVPEVAMMPNGTAFITWALNAGAGHVAQVMIRSPNGSLGSPQTLSTTNVDTNAPYTGVRTAVNRRGDAIVTWDRYNGGARVVEAAYRARGADTFGATQTVSAAPGTIGAVFPAPAIDDDGNATIVWEDCGSGSCDAIKTNFRPAGAASAFLGVEPIVGPTGGFTGFPRVAVDSEGTAIAIWHNATGGTNKVQLAVRPLNRSFSPAEDVSSSTGTTRFTNIDFDARDNAIATWSRSVAGAFIVQAIGRPKSGSFGAVTNVSQPGVFSEAAPAIGVDEQGNAIVAWTRHNGTNFVAEAAGYDAAPPSLSNVSIPTTGVAGNPVSFSVTARDVWSPVAVAWTFGDGASGTGSSIAHAFNPGAFNVTARATDAAGNFTSTSRAVQIANPPPPPGGGGGLDADGDGFFAGQDCNDGNPAIRPGAEEIRGNTVDENCDGQAERFPQLRFTLSNAFKAFTNFTRLQRIQAKSVPRGSTVKATCKVKKKKCKGKARKAFTKRKARGTVSLNKRYKRVKLRAGTKITVTVTKPGFIGAVKIFQVRRRKAPKTTDRCLPPGARRPQRC